MPDSKSRLSLATALLLFSGVLGAQGTPVTPMPVIAPPPPVAPSTPAAPPADAVALCADGTFVLAPRPAGDCGARGGVKVLMPPRPVAPPRPTTVLPAPAALLAAPVNSPPPANASMRCKDGTWLSGAPSAARCDSKGGVAVILPRPPVTPPASARKP